MRSNRIRTFALGVLAAAMCAATSIAVGQSNIPPSLHLELPASAKHGGKISGTLTVSFGPGLHAYQNPPSDPDLIPVVVSLETKGATLKPVKYPRGTNMSVGGDPKPVKVYSGTIQIPVTIVIPAKRGRVKLMVKLSYQQCNSNSCYPPSDEETSATLTVH